MQKTQTLFRTLSQYRLENIFIVQEDLTVDYIPQRKEKYVYLN